MELTQLTPIISAVATVVLVVLLAIKEWKSGSTQISSEIITNYRTLDDQQKKTIEEYKTALAEATSTIKAMEVKFGERVAKYEGIIQAKDKQIETLTLINANRNPELEKVLTDIRDFMKKMVETNVFQTTILTNQQERNKKIDDASSKHEGDILRKPTDK